MTRQDRHSNATAPWARALSFPAVLRDGRRVRVRPITPTDKARIAQAMQTMSPRTRYLRFHSLRSAFTEEELRHLTELDYEHHVAWGAIAEDERGRPGIGSARFIRDPEMLDAAEFSITVVDAWQGHGLGSLLLRTLLVSAAERNVRKLVGTVLAENVGALRLFRRFGGEWYRFDDESLIVEIPVTPVYRTPRMSQEVLVRRPA
jgi:RimJ/RimL family protein N-acetyltransferase